MTQSCSEWFVDNTAQVLLMWLAFGAWSLLMGAWGAWSERGKIEREAVKRGLARYNPKTSDWEWLPKEDQK